MWPRPGPPSRHPRAKEGSDQYQYPNPSPPDPPVKFPSGSPAGSPSSVARLPGATRPQARSEQVRPLVAPRLRPIDSNGHRPPEGGLPGTGPGRSGCPPHPRRRPAGLDGPAVRHPSPSRRRATVAPSPAGQGRPLRPSGRLGSPTSRRAASRSPPAAARSRSRPAAGRGLVDQHAQPAHGGGPAGLGPGQPGGDRRVVDEVDRHLPRPEGGRVHQRLGVSSRPSRPGWPRPPGPSPPPQRAHPPGPSPRPGRLPPTLFGRSVHHHHLGRPRLGQGQDDGPRRAARPDAPGSAIPPGRGRTPAQGLYEPLARRCCRRSGGRPPSAGS